MSWRHVAGSLVDPTDRSPLEFDEHTRCLLSPAGNSYPLVDGQPSLLPKSGLEVGGWRFPPVEVTDVARPKPIRRGRSLAKAYQRFVRKLVGGQGASDHFHQLLCEENGGAGRPVVLVVGGATIGDGFQPIADDPNIDVVTFDVYPTRHTTFVADAHRIPLDDGSVDAVWVQAVLEHVYRPDVVVAEIARVLRSKGLVYAETPFLQPVHEGAFDFMRFSVSGHRLLWSDFDEVAAGPLGGPAASALLAMRGLVGGITRSPAAARIAYMAMIPWAVMDRAVASGWRRDFATGSYFLGRLDPQRRGFDAPSYYATSEERSTRGRSTKTRVALPR